TAALGIVPTGTGELSIYVARHKGQRSHHLERMTLRTDGFASIGAPYGGGAMVTKPLHFTGRELVINFSTSAAGVIRTELQDASGRPMPSYSLEESLPIIGDELERVVRWKRGSDLSGLQRGPVRVRFVMKDADLFSLRFR